MFRIPFVCLASSLFAATASGGEPVDYLRDVKPIFAKYCVDCHGPAKQKAGLRLDTAAAARKGNDGGLVIVQGKAKESPLVHALLGEKELAKMPPEGRPRPSDAEIATIKRWID